MRVKNFLLLFLLFFVSIININANIIDVTAKNKSISTVVDPALQESILNNLIERGAPVSTTSDITQDIIDTYINDTSNFEKFIVESNLQTTEGFNSVITKTNSVLILKDVAANQNIDFSGIKYPNSPTPGYLPVYIINKGSLNLHDFSKPNYSELFSTAKFGSGLSVYSGFKNIGTEITHISEGYEWYTNGRSLKESNIDPLEYDCILNENNYKKFKISLNKLYVNDSYYEFTDTQGYRDWMAQYQFANQDFDTVPARFDYGGLYNNNSTYLERTETIKVTLNDIELEYKISFDWNNKLLIFTLQTTGVTYDDIKNAQSKSSTMYLSHFFHTPWKRSINPAYMAYYNIQLLYNLNLTTEYIEETEIETGQVTLIKKDKDSKKTLSNAEFSLQNKNGVTLYSKLKTDSDGKINIKDLKYGEYTFIETNAPTNYIIKNKNTKFNITKENNSIYLEVFNTKKDDSGNDDANTDKPPLPKSGSSINLIIFSLAFVISLIFYKRKLLGNCITHE